MDCADPRPALRLLSPLVILALVGACADDTPSEGGADEVGSESTSADESSEDSESSESASESSESSSAEDTGTGTSESSSEDSESSESTSDEGTIFDVGAQPDLRDPGEICTVPDEELDALPPCEEAAAADSFDPVVQWDWSGEGLHVNAITTPLVANLTDDNDDGAVDLCDVPDIVVMTHDGLNNAPERLWVFDGATGEIHWDLDAGLRFSQVPAIGDVDDDGLPEIVAVTAAGQLQIISNEGAVQSTANPGWLSSFAPALGLADFDNDGDAEIYAGGGVLDHTGATVFHVANEGLVFYHTSAAADLDGDGDLELIVGRNAYHHDGSSYYSHPQLVPGHAAVGDLDDDGLPEVLVSGAQGVSLIEHDGTLTLAQQTPSGDPPVSNNWWRPTAIHDFTANGEAEFAISSANNYNVIRGDFSLVWSAPVADLTGIAAGTAFDFLGDGSAEAIYGDEDFLFVFDDSGDAIFQVPRASRTTTEYPVVADVDNDGSAEIVVVSESELPGGAATVQVIGDAEDRWVPARRIWNQHGYHVTNVREDGTLPQFEPPAWEAQNTYRTQAQAEDGVCLPEPQG